MTTMTHENVGTDTWTEVVTGHERAFVQLQSQGAVLLHIGSSAPADSSRVGLVLESGAVEEVAFDALEDGDSIYARSLGAGPAGVETLLVAQSGAFA